MKNQFEDGKKKCKAEELNCKTGEYAKPDELALNQKLIKVTCVA